jgi:hypothetical protein
MEQNACENCPQGKISTIAGASSCSVCNNGQNMNSTGKHTCDTCAAGKYKKEQPFEGDPRTVYLCKSCEVGMYQNSAGQASCLPCFPGSFMDEKGATDAHCKLCAENEYRSSAMDATVCVSCPDGWFSMGGSAACSRCAAGTFGNAVGNGCQDCDVGLYRANSDAPESCKRCSVGFSQSQKAQASW